MEKIVELKENSVIKKIYTITGEMGFEVFLVGGSVRDLFLSLPFCQDYDFVLGLQKKGNREVINKDIRHEII